MERSLGRENAAVNETYWEDEGRRESAGNWESQGDYGGPAFSVFSRRLLLTGTGAVRLWTRADTSYAWNAERAMLLPEFQPGWRAVRGRCAESP